MKMMKDFAAWLTMALAMVFLAACAGTQPLEKPQSFEDRVQYARAGISASYRTVGDLVASRQLDPLKASEAVRKLDDLDAQVSLASSLMAQGKPTDAELTLSTVTRLLLVVRSSLATPGSKP